MYAQPATNLNAWSADGGQAASYIALMLGWHQECEGARQCRSLHLGNRRILFSQGDHAGAHCSTPEQSGSWGWTSRLRYRSHLHPGKQEVPVKVWLLG